MDGVYRNVKVSPPRVCSPPFFFLTWNIFHLDPPDTVLIAKMNSTDVDFSSLDLLTHRKKNILGY